MHHLLLTIPALLSWQLWNVFSCVSLTITCIFKKKNIFLKHISQILKIWINQTYINCSIISLLVSSFGESLLLQYLHKQTEILIDQSKIEYLYFLKLCFYLNYYNVVAILTFMVIWRLYTIDKWYLHTVLPKLSPMAFINNYICHQ